MRKEDALMGNPLAALLISIGWEVLKYWIKKKFSRTATVSLIPMEDEPDYDAFKAASLN